MRWKNNNGGRLKGSLSSIFEALLPYQDHNKVPGIFVNENRIKNEKTGQISLKIRVSNDHKPLNIRRFEQH